MKQSIEKLRHEYGNLPLEGVDVDPFVQFSSWLHEAIQCKVMEPNGMVLSTVSRLGHCSSRTVLLKGVDEKGFLFFTHYTSRKGQQIEEEKSVGVTFWWKEIFRQVNIEGKAKRVSREISRAYFAKRPRGAQIAAHVSAQSSPLADRQELTELFQAVKKRYAYKPIPCPTSWGGYRIIPHRFEFWQGRKNRLHDRFLYVKTDGLWIQTRLFP